ncbi:MAG: hypothetical protein IMX00_10930 [Limnochordales bacterium]|nr:hypothetical protein [Limnochordales bacterium]
MPSVVGLFSSRDQAEKAVKALKEKGITEKEISLVAKEETLQGGQRQGKRDVEAGDMGTGQDLTSGATWGGTLGGLAGLLASAGALAIPGIGPLVAAGPIAATLGGAAAGGLAGSLIDWGIGGEAGKKYEEGVKRGEILAAVKADQAKVETAAAIMRQNGAKDVEVH